MIHRRLFFLILFVVSAVAGFTGMSTSQGQQIICAQEIRAEFYPQDIVCQSEPASQCPFNGVAQGYAYIGANEIECINPINRFCASMTTSNTPLSADAKYCAGNPRYGNCTAGIYNGRYEPSIEAKINEIKSILGPNSVVGLGECSQDIGGRFYLKIPKITGITDTYEDYDKIVEYYNQGFSIARGIGALASTQVAFCRTSNSILVNDSQTGISRCYENVSNPGQMRPCYVDNLLGRKTCITGFVSDASIPHGAFTTYETVRAPTIATGNNDVCSIIQSNDRYRCANIVPEDDTKLQQIIAQLSTTVGDQGASARYNNYNGTSYSFCRPSANFVVIDNFHKMPAPSGVYNYAIRPNDPSNPIRFNLEITNEIDISTQCRVPSNSLGGEITFDSRVVIASDPKQCTKTAQEVLFANSNKGCSAFVKTRVDSAGNVTLEKLPGYDSCSQCIYGADPLAVDTYDVEGIRRSKCTDLGYSNGCIGARFGSGTRTSAAGIDTSQFPNYEPFFKSINGRVYTDLGGCIDTSSTPNIINTIFLIALSLMGGITVIRIIQGVLMLQSADPEQVAEGQQIISSALIGLITLILSAVGLNFLAGTVLRLDSPGGSGNFQPFG